MDDTAYVLKLPKKESPQLDLVVDEDVDKTQVKKALEDAKNEVKLLLSDADQEVADMLEKAEKSSESIVLDAYEKAEGVFNKARDEGYEQGFDQGLMEGSQSLDQHVQEVLDLKKNLEKERRNIYTTSEHQMIQIVLESIDKVFEHRLETDETMVEQLIKQGIAKITKSHVITIRISNQDYDRALHAKPNLLLGSERIERIDMKSDNSLPKGSCIIESDVGAIDSSFHVQLDHLKHALLELLKEDEDA